MPQKISLANLVGPTARAHLTHAVGEQSVSGLNNHMMFVANKSGGLFASLGERATPALNSAGGIFAALGKNFAAILGVGLTAALSTGITQWHYRNEREEIRKLYENEIAAQLGKNPKDLTDKDLTLFAKGDPKRGIPANRTIGEAIDKAKRHRNLSFVTATIASLVALGAVYLAVQGGMFVGMGLVTAFFAEAAVSVASSNSTRMMLNWGAQKIFHIKQETANDRITALEEDREAGKNITREQVAGVLIEADLKLGNRVTEQFGKSFEDLNEQEKNRAIAVVLQALPVEQLTNEINQGKLRVTQLAFIATRETPAQAPITTLAMDTGAAPEVSYVQRLQQQRAGQQFSPAAGRFSS